MSEETKEQNLKAAKKVFEETYNAVKAELSEVELQEQKFGYGRIFDPVSRRSAELVFNDQNPHSWRSNFTYELKTARIRITTQGGRYGAVDKRVGVKNADAVIESFKIWRQQRARQARQNNERERFELRVELIMEGAGIRKANYISEYSRPDKTEYKIEQERGLGRVVKIAEPKSGRSFKITTLFDFKIDYSANEIEIVACGKRIEHRRENADYELGAIVEKIIGC